jgi:hypothetical protein
MTTFNLKIDKLNVISDVDEQGLENVVYSVDYIVTGEDGDYKASASRTIGLNSPTKANFKSLESLTEQDILEFVRSSVAPDDIKCAELEVQIAIDKTKNPTKTAVSIQWPLSN